MNVFIETFMNDVLNTITKKGCLDKVDLFLRYAECRIFNLLFRITT